MRKDKQGFTLIELMVATVIFVIIIFILSAIFHQGSVAWDSGTRRAEGNMTARAVLGFMAKELSQAVADSDKLKADIANGSSSIKFVAFRGSCAEEIADSTNRMARQIQYRLDGDVIKRAEWKRVADVGEGAYGGSWQLAESEVAIAERVTKLKFYTFDSEDFTTNLPGWVRIEVALRRTDDISGVGAFSAGPDKDFDKETDNITSW